MDFAIQAPEDTEEEFRLRGTISNNTNSYFIINELESKPYMKILTGVKLNSNKEERQNNIFEDGHYNLAYFSKKYIKQTIFDKQNWTKKEIQIFYQNLKQNFEKYSTVKRENIQEMIDFVETADGIFYIMEFCDISLSDYLNQLRIEKWISETDMELHVRGFIISILSCLSSAHEENMHYCGLIDIKDIYLQKLSNKEYKEHEENKENKNHEGYIIKFLHPCLSDLMTLLKIYDKKECPSFFAPEIYEKFKNKEEIDKQLSFYGSFEAVSIILKGFANFVFDFWSAGVLFYQMIFDKKPFQIKSLNSYDTDLKVGMTYEMNTFCITEKMEKLISGCLLYKMEKRLGGNLIEKILRDLNKEKDNKQDTEKELKIRNEKLIKEKKTFNI